MALTQQAILENLHEIQAPGGRMSLVEAGAVRGIDVEDDGSVKVVLAVEATDPTVASEVRKAVEASLAQVEGVGTVEVIRRADALTPQGRRYSYVATYPARGGGVAIDACPNAALPSAWVEGLRRRSRSLLRRADLI